MLRAYKYRIYPTPEQEVLFSKTFGCCRYVYNWALNLKIEAYKSEKKTLGNVYLTNLMKSDLKERCEWLKEVNSQSLQSALRNLDAAYANFFRDTHAVGFPKFKSRKEHQSFQCPQHCSVDFKRGVLNIPKAKGIPAVFHRKFKGSVKTVTVSKTPGGNYYASVLVETAMEPCPKTKPCAESTIGIDLGIKSLAVTSSGQFFENHKYLKQSLARLAFLQKNLSRKRKGSANREKARIKVARLQERIGNQRRDSLHKITHQLTHDNQVRTVCMENLNVKGMSRNRHLAQSVSDASMGMFLSLLEYKCEWYGVNLIKIDRFAPSSKTCSHCGYLYKDLKLNERTWTCPVCHTRLDRDLNAAINIKEFGLKNPTPGAGESQACGETTCGRPGRKSPKKQCSDEAGKVKVTITRSSCL